MKYCRVLSHIISLSLICPYQTIVFSGLIKICNSSKVACQENGCNLPSNRGISVVVFVESTLLCFCFIFYHSHAALKCWAMKDRVICCLDMGQFFSLVDYFGDPSACEFSDCPMNSK